jgi:hypothetical protein
MGIKYSRTVLEEFVKHQSLFHKPSVTVVGSLSHTGYIKWSLSGATVITRTLKNGTYTQWALYTGQPWNELIMWSVSPSCLKQHITFLFQCAFTYNLLYIQKTVMTSKHLDYLIEVCFTENAHRKCFWVLNKLNSLIKLMYTLPFGKRQHLSTENTNPATCNSIIIVT